MTQEYISNGRKKYLILSIFVISLFVGFLYSQQTLNTQTDNGGGEFSRSNLIDLKQAATPTQRKSFSFFPETGHWVSGPFLTKYESVSEPEQLFGLPITDAYKPKDKNVQVQYFQRARFEYHPNASTDQGVILTPLGEYLYEPGEEVKNPFAGGCKTFEQTGYEVCFDFLSFYLEHGGVSQFGYPISNMEIHNDVFTQYFQYAVLEYRPNMAEEFNIYLAPIGVQYFHFIGENEIYLNPGAESNIPLQIPVKLNVFPFTEPAITSKDDNIRLYILVRDENNAFVEDALIVYQVVFPDGSMETCYPGTTDANGLNVSEFEVTSKTAGLAKISIAVGWGEIMTDTNTTFQIAP